MRSQSSDDIAEKGGRSSSKWIVAMPRLPLARLLHAAHRTHHASHVTLYRRRAAALAAAAGLAVVVMPTCHKRRKKIYYFSETKTRPRIPCCTLCCSGKRGDHHPVANFAFGIQLKCESRKKCMCVTLNKMRFFMLFCFLVAAAPALFAAGRDDGPVAFSLLEHCKTSFKCKVRGFRSTMRSSCIIDSFSGL